MWLDWLHWFLNGHPSQDSHWYFSSVRLSLLPFIGVSFNLKNFLPFGQIGWPSSSILKLTDLNGSSWNFLLWVSFSQEANFINNSIWLFLQNEYVSKLPYPASATGVLG